MAEQLNKTSAKDECVKSQRHIHGRQAFPCPLHIERDLRDARCEMYMGVLHMQCQM